MKRILVSLLAAGALSLSLPARADSTSLNADCSFEGGVQCTAQCTEVAFHLQCAGKADVDCKAKLPTSCTVDAKASCTGSCQGSCESKCKVDPPSFNCTAQCSAQANIDCAARAQADCKAEANAAECQSRAEARCKAQLQGQCQAKCDGTGGSVDCTAKCQASCDASCDVSAKVACDGYLKCQGTAQLTCESELTGGCKTQCSTSGGALVCNGQVVSFYDTLDKAKAWLKAHGYADATATCSGSSCEAKANAGVSCQLSPADHGGSLALLAGTVLGLGLTLRRLRPLRRQ